MKKRIGIVLLTLALGMAATACAGNGDSSSSGSSASLKTVRFASVNQQGLLSDNGGVAQTQKLMEEELAKVGYKPEYLGFAAAGPAINEAFSAKSIDIAFYGDLPAMVFKSKGGGTTIFATANSQVQMALFVPKDSSIRSFKDLEGKKVVVGVGTIYQQYYQSLVKKNGLDASKISVINTVSDAQTVIANKQADALVTALVNAYYYESLGIGKVVETTIDEPDLTNQFFAVGRSEYLKENPKVPAAIIRALVRAQQYTVKNPTSVYTAFAKASGAIPAAAFQKSMDYDAKFSYYKPAITSDSLTKLQALDEFLISNKLIAQKVDIDSFVDTSYLKEAGVANE